MVAPVCHLRRRLIRAHIVHGVACRPHCGAHRAAARRPAIVAGGPMARPTICSMGTRMHRGSPKGTAARSPIRLWAAEAVAGETLGRFFDESRAGGRITCPQIFWWNAHRECLDCRGLGLGGQGAGAHHDPRRDSTDGRCAEADLTAVGPPPVIPVHGVFCSYWPDCVGGSPFVTLANPPLPQPDLEHRHGSISVDYRRERRPGG